MDNHGRTADIVTIESEACSGGGVTSTWNHSDPTQQQLHHHHHQQEHHQQQDQYYHQYPPSLEDNSPAGGDQSCRIENCCHNSLKRQPSGVMMVTKLWNSCFPEFASQKVHRHNFYLCQWQQNTQVRIIYLLYRWLTAITCLAVLVCSLLDVGRSDEHFEHHYAKWWIYLTHWGLLACTSQAWLGAWIVTQGMMVEREDFELVRQAKKSKMHHLYWIMYTIATVYSFIITMCYWVLVHNPEIHKVDALNIMVHVFNSVIMLIDLAIVGHPIKLSHAYWTTGIGVVYAIFTGIYFLAGGTDRKNKKTIYPLLDWTKPGKAIVVTACAILFVFVVHFAVYSLYRLRVCLFTKLCIRHTGGERDSELGEGLDPDRQLHPHHHPQQEHCQFESSSEQLQQQQPQHTKHYTNLYQDNNNKKKNKMSSLSQTVSSLENSQREHFLNSSKIVEMKM